MAGPMDWQHLPVEEAACLPNEIEQELADLARGVLPPKLNFAPLRKATVDRALAELGLTRLGTAWALDIRGFRVALDLFRDKSNRAFSIDLGLQPLILWDDAIHANHPTQSAMFRGRVMLDGGRCWWRHDLDRERAIEVLAMASDFLRSRLLIELNDLTDFCDRATPEHLASPPQWLDPLWCDPISFARYRLAAGRQAEAIAFARIALARMGDDSPLGRLRPLSPIELEMRAIVET